VCLLNIDDFSDGLNNDLKSCRFCGEDFQLQVIRVDMKNPERDLIKCRKCRGEAPRKFWNNDFDER